MAENKDVLTIGIVLDKAMEAFADRPEQAKVAEELRNFMSDVQDVPLEPHEFISAAVSVGKVTSMLRDLRARKVGKAEGPEADVGFVGSGVFVPGELDA